MGATCSKCCLCYCFKLVEFGDSFRCRHSCCIQYCEPCCHCGDCCDAEDDLPFVKESELVSSEEEAVVYLNGDKYTGAMQNNKKHGYGELTRKDGTRLSQEGQKILEDFWNTVTTGSPFPETEHHDREDLKGYFVDDHFIGETPADNLAVASATDHESNSALKQAGSNVSHRELQPLASTDGPEERLRDT